MAFLLVGAYFTKGQGQLIGGLLIRIGFATAVTFTNAVIPTMNNIFGAITGIAHAFVITIATIIIYAISTQGPKPEPLTAVLQMIWFRASMKVKCYIQAL